MTDDDLKPEILTALHLLFDGMDTSLRRRYFRELEPPPDRIDEWVCDNCGSSDVEVRVLASWDKGIGAWEITDLDLEEDKCRDCGNTEFFTWASYRKLSPKVSLK